jgi:hypothetical protein
LRETEEEVTYGRVPVGVVEDDGIGSSQVDTETSGTGREQEDEEFGPERTILGSEPE